MFGDLHYFECVCILLCYFWQQKATQGVTAGRRIKRNVYQTGKVFTFDKSSDEVWEFYSSKTNFTTCWTHLLHSLLISWPAAHPVHPLGQTGDELISVAKALWFKDVKSYNCGKKLEFNIMATVWTLSYCKVLRPFHFIRTSIRKRWFLVKLLVHFLPFKVWIWGVVESIATIVGVPFPFTARFWE